MKKILVIVVLLLFASFSNSFSSEFPETVLLDKGKDAYENKDYKSALFYYGQSSAIELDSAAEYYMGIMYQNGEGVEIDFKAAFEHYSIAVERGHYLAIEKLGSFYEFGRAVDKDYEKAFNLYLMAANRGGESAMRLVAIMYFDGNGIERNEEEGFKWLLKSAEAKDSEAMYLLAKAYEDAKGTDRNLVKAFNWALKASETGLVEAEFLLGVYYSSGSGIGIDKAKAFKLFKKLAQNNTYYPAMLKVSEMYREGKGVKKNVKLANFWKSQSER